MFRAAVRQWSSIFSILCSVSDGILLYAQKYAKGVKGTPLKIPDFLQESPMVLALLIFGTCVSKG